MVIFRLFKRVISIRLGETWLLKSRKKIGVYLMKSLKSHCSGAHD